MHGQHRSLALWDGSFYQQLIMTDLDLALPRRRAVSLPQERAAIAGDRETSEIEPSLRIIAIVDRLICGARTASTTSRPNGLRRRTRYTSIIAQSDPDHIATF